MDGPSDWSAGKRVGCGRGVKASQRPVLQLLLCELPQTGSETETCVKSYEENCDERM